MSAPREKSQYGISSKIRDHAMTFPETVEGVGTGGWTLIRFPPDAPPPLEDLQRWITESFYLLAPNKVLKLLED